MRRKVPYVKFLSSEFFSGRLLEVRNWLMKLVQVSWRDIEVVSLKGLLDFCCRFIIHLEIRLPILLEGSVDSYEGGSKFSWQVSYRVD